MSHYKAVLSDLDGTLFGPDLIISMESRNALHQLRERNIHFIPVTGRDYDDVKGLLADQEVDGLGVFSGGSVIVEQSTGATIWEKTIDLDVCREVVAAATRFAEVIGFGLGRMAVASIVVKEIEVAPKSIWIEYHAGRELEVEEFRAAFPGLTCHSSSYNDPRTTGLHITPRGIDKFASTMKVLSMLRIEPASTLAIGDGMNDLPLFEVAGTSVAMGNSPEELKREATFVTLGLMEGGFAKAIEDLVLADH